MRAVFQKLTTSTLRERIVVEIREAILTGALFEGERLVERKLAAQFATSLTTVREALVQLETEGFVIKKPNAATYVMKLTLEAAEKIFAARRVVETFAVEEAARLATPEQIQELESIYHEMVDAARSLRAQDFIIQDLNMHEKIWEIAGNEYLELALRRINLPLFAYTAIRTLTHDTFDLLQDAESHLQILEGIKAHDPAMAKVAWLAALNGWLAKSRAYVFGNSQQADPSTGSKDQGDAPRAEEQQRSIQK